MKACKWCGSVQHTQFYCFHKVSKPIKRASKPIRREAEKTKAKRLVTAAEWFSLNPPDEYGRWECYLHISPRCLVLVDTGTIVLEHVVAKVRDASRKYDVTNIEAGCDPCNELKGSRSIEELAVEFPHLKVYL